MSEMEHRELLMLLEHLWNDIQQTKQRQWHDFYNILIAEGAIVGLIVAINSDLQNWFPKAGVIAILLLTSIGIALVKASQATLAQQRELVDECYSKLYSRSLLTTEAAQAVHRDIYPLAYWFILVGGGLFSALTLLGLK